MNPSTRPLVAKESGSPDPGAPAAPQSASGSVTAPGAFNDHAFTVPAGDNASAAFRAQWTTPASDWDAELFRDVNGNGVVDAGEPSVGSSAQGVTDFEEITVAAPSGAYVLRVTNYAAVEGYAVTVTYAAPPPFKPAATEAYTLTCERDGAVLASQPVVVERGAAVRVDPCPAAPDSVSQETPRGGATATSSTKPTACQTTPRLAVRPSGRGLRAGSAAALYRVATPRRVTAAKLVAEPAGRDVRRACSPTATTSRAPATPRWRSGARTGASRGWARSSTGRAPRPSRSPGRSSTPAACASRRGPQSRSGAAARWSSALARGGTFRASRPGEYRFSAGGVTLAARRL